MPAFTLPDPTDAKESIADYLATLPNAPSTQDRREHIINDCVKSVTLLIEAGTQAIAAGPEAEAAFIYFIRLLYAQVQTSTREKHFADLLEKLSVGRMH